MKLGRTLGFRVSDTGFKAVVIGFKGMVSLSSRSEDTLQADVITATSSDGTADEIATFGGTLE